MYALRWSALALSLVLSQSPLLAQTPTPEELKSSVAALDAMHELITPMWHVAWPAKDVKALAAMVPDLEKHLAAIRKATLPGILQDKQQAWDEGVSALAATADAYRRAAQVPDSVALLAAAEKLHMRYEKLVGLIRPALPEVDAFHQTLYVVYHYQLDPFSMSKIAASAKEMAIRMDALNRAVLPARMQAKGPAFEATRSALAVAVTGLQHEVTSGDEKRVRLAVEDVHAKYELLEVVFK